MKKITIAAALFLTLGLVFTSCNETKKEVAPETTKEVTKEVEETKEVVKEEMHEHSDEMAMAVYQCPMKCEGDKTYDKEGTCPKCNMELKKVEVDAEKTEASKEEHKEEHKE